MDKDPPTPSTDAELPTAKSKRISRSVMLLDEAYRIEQEDAERAGAIGYMANTLVQVHLPYRDPCTWANGRADLSSLFYSRANGKVSLLIRGMPQYGVPFGSIPRLLMAWVCTEAVRTDSRELVMGNSAASFARKLDLSLGGRDLTRLKKQFMALVRAAITVDGLVLDGQGLQWRNIQLASDGFMFWDDKTPSQSSLWQTTLTLTDEFFRTILSHPVPLKLDVLRALSQSPMAMDIYVWLPYRIFTLTRAGRARVDITWEQLHGQFGTGCSGSPAGLRDFKSKFIKRMKEVLVFYPEAASAISTSSSCLTLRPAPPHIAPRSEQRKLG